MMEKKKVLVLGDSPTCSTGFGNVVRNILGQIHKTGLYDITVIGINHAGQPHDYPYKIYPAINVLSDDSKYKNPFGLQLFIDNCCSGYFDIVFVVQDTFIVKQMGKALGDAWESLPKDKKFSSIYYFPVDSVLQKSWVNESVVKFNHPVVYTKYGKEECLKINKSLYNMDIIYHGVDKKIFYPINKDKAKEEIFPSRKGKYVITNIARNQPRKDLHKTFAAFSLLKEKRQDVFLYILAQRLDVGGDLIAIAENYGLKINEDWICPNDNVYGANQGFPIEVVNKIYNASDVIVSSTLAEGFGLMTVEAMATGTPIIVPRNTSLVEIIGENEERGWFCDSGKTLNDHVVIPHDNNILRSTIDVYDMANKIDYVLNHPDEANEKAQEAFAWVPSWDDVGKKWIEIFAKASNGAKRFGYLGG